MHEQERPRPAATQGAACRAANSWQVGGRAGGAGRAAALAPGWWPGHGDCGAHHSQGGAGGQERGLKRGNVDVECGEAEQRGDVTARSGADFHGCDAVGDGDAGLQRMTPAGRRQRVCRFTFLCQYVGVDRSGVSVTHVAHALPAGGSSTVSRLGSGGEVPCLFIALRRRGAGRGGGRLVVRCRI